MSKFSYENYTRDIKSVEDLSGVFSEWQPFLIETFKMEDEKPEAFLIETVKMELDKHTGNPPPKRRKLYTLSKCYAL